MFIGYSRWVEQYFNGIDSSEKIIISCNDSSAWKNNPDYNWVYNKLELCKTQGIDAEPHGILPRVEPVFSKPIINLYGKNRGAHKIFSWDESKYQAGHFCMPVLTGAHLTSDLVVIKGICQWMYTMQAYDDGNGNISHYESCNGDFDELTEKVMIWALKHLKGYTGMLNAETIGGRIIDCHLRMTPRFIDLYGKNWLESVVILYEKGTWKYEWGHKLGVSYTMRASEDGTYIISDEERLEDLRSKAGSIQVIVHDNEEVEVGDRLVIVNGHDAKQVNKILKELEEIIILTEE